MTIEDFVQSGIIEPEALNELLVSDTSSVKLIDATFVLPGAEKNPHDDYMRARIDHAVFFDIDEIADHETDLPHMLPSPDVFENAVSTMGISNDDLVVVYGQEGMIMGPARAWWTFRVFGHDKVCVLNGGLPAWIREGFEVNTALPDKTSPGNFEADFRPELVRNANDVLQASENGSDLIYDARPAERFAGTAPEPRPGMKSGHIPGSRSLPCPAFIDHETGKFKPRTDIEHLFRECGLKQASSVIASCGSGVTACVIGLALHHIGHERTAIYDGSWSEWGKPDGDFPIEKV